MFLLSWKLAVVVISNLPWGDGALEGHPLPAAGAVWAALHQHDPHHHRVRGPGPRLRQGQRVIRSLFLFLADPGSDNVFQWGAPLSPLQYCGAENISSGFDSTEPQSRISAPDLAPALGSFIRYFEITFFGLSKRFNMVTVYKNFFSNGNILLINFFKSLVNRKERGAAICNCGSGSGKQFNFGSQLSTLAPQHWRSKSIY